MSSTPRALIGSLAALFISAALLTGCPPEDVAGDGAIEIDLRSSNFTREFGARCGLNTSAPMGDPARGTFFVSIVSENADGDTMNASISFTEFTDTPAAGVYTVSSAISVFAQLNDERVEPIEGDIDIDFDGDLMIVTFRTTSNIRGTARCVP